MQRKSLLLALLLGLSFSVSAQHTDQFTIAMGSSVWHEWLPENVHYIPSVVLGSFPVWQRKNFFIYAEGQLTYAINQKDFNSEYEIGGNMGIGYRIPFTSWWDIAGRIGSGPNFISIETRRQAKGFLFSDNFELETNFRIKQIGTSIQLKSRYRHISNAGLKKPNGGIDNLIIFVGLKKWLRPKEEKIFAGVEGHSSSK
jgi:hypothetical protein